MSGAVSSADARIRRSRRMTWLREIRHYQRTVDCVIPRQSFQRLCREVAQDYKVQCESICWYRYLDETFVYSVRFESVALEALRVAVEDYLTGLLHDANLCAIHACRVTLMVRDMKLARRLRGEVSALDGEFGAWEMKIKNFDFLRFPYAVWMNKLWPETRPIFIQLASYEKLRIVEPRVVWGWHSALWRCAEWCTCPSTHPRQLPSVDLDDQPYCTKHSHLVLSWQKVLLHETQLEVLCPIQWKCLLPQRRLGEAPALEQMIEMTQYIGSPSGWRALSYTFDSLHRVHSIAQGLL